MSRLNSSAAPVRAATRARLWPRLAAAILLSAGLLGAFIITYKVFISTIRGQWLDERALIGARTFLAETPILNNELEWLTQLPVGIAIAGLILCAIAAVSRKSVVVPLVAAGTASVGVVVVRILKDTLLERPYTGVSEAYVNSFPSGHSALAMAGMLAALVALPARARTWFGFVGALVAALGGSATLIMSWHRPADIVGAYLVIGCCIVLAAGVIGWVDRSPRAPTFSSKVCLVLGLSVTVLSAALMLLPEFTNAAQSKPLTMSAHDAATGASAWVTVLAVGLITGTSLALFGLVERLAAPARR